MPTLRGRGSSRYAAISLLKRYPRRDQAFLESRFDYEKLIQNFGRVKDFGELSDDYRNWTFWTYVQLDVQLSVQLDNWTNGLILDIIEPFFMMLLLLQTLQSK